MKKNRNTSLHVVSFLSCLIKIIPIFIGLVVARLLSTIVEEATAGHTGFVISRGVLLLGVMVATKLFEYFAMVWYRKKESLVVHNCKMKLYRKCLSSPLSRLYTFGFGDAKEKLTDDFQTVIGKYTSLYPDVGSGMVTVVVYFSFLAKQKMEVAIILLGISLILLIPPIITNKFLQVNYEKCRDIESSLYDFTVSGYRGFLTIKLYGLKQWWLSKLKEYHKAYAKIGSESIYMVNAESALMEFSSMVAQYGTFALMGVLILFRKVDRTVAVEAIALSAGFFAAIKVLFSSIPKFGVAKIAQTRLSQWDSSDSTGEQERKKTRSAGLQSEISLCEVTYRAHGKLIFDHVTITLDKDNCYLIKGENGVGKSTLFRLLTGLVSCDSGCISIFGCNPMELTEEEFHKHIFYLAQEDVVFDLTPMEIYEMVVPHLKDEILLNAKEFGFSEEQLQTVQISELSGGERKKVYLALAFAQNPDILFLDEPTNSLDKEGKQVLATKLSSRTGSTWIISHDPMLDNLADAILYVEERGLTVEKNKTK